MWIATRSLVAVLIIAAMATAIALACGSSEIDESGSSSQGTAGLSDSVTTTIRTEDVDIGSESAANTVPSEPTPTVHPTWSDERFESYGKGPGTSTFEEWVQHRAEINRRYPGESSNTKLGPETAGSVLTVAGLQIQLPDDAYIHQIVNLVVCLGESVVVVGEIAVEETDLCPPQTPYYDLARGDSTVRVVEQTGRVFGETIAPGEEGAFNFLKEALAGVVQSQSGANAVPSDPTPIVRPTWTNEQIDAVFDGPNTPTYDEHRQASAELDRGGTILKTDGPETAGSSLSVGSRLIQLPADVHIKFAVSHAACLVGGFCPATPYYVLARGRSTITVEGPTGKILEEDIVPGEEGAFDFLKEALGILP